MKTINDLADFIETRELVFVIPKHSFAKDLKYQLITMGMSKQQFDKCRFISNWNDRAKNIIRGMDKRNIFFYNVEPFGGYE